MASHTQSGNQTHSTINQQTLDIIIKHISVNERPTRFPYADKNGKITVGIGFLVDDINAFENLPLEYVDLVTGSKRPATVSEKRQAFNDLRAENKRVGNNIHAEYYEDVTSVRMADTEMTRRVEAAVLTRYHNC